MDKKMYKIMDRRAAAEDKINDTNTKNDEREYTKALKWMMGIALVVVAAAFGGVVSSLPAPIAFAVVFSYICAQLLIWLK